MESRAFRAILDINAHSKGLEDPPLCEASYTIGQVFNQNFSERQAFIPCVARMGSEQSPSAQGQDG
jgi:hypothetical protein